MELSSGKAYNFSVAGVDMRDIIGLFSEPVIIELSGKYGNYSDSMHLHYV